MRKQGMTFPLPSRVPPPPPPGGGGHDRRRARPAERRDVPFGFTQRALLRLTGKVLSLNRRRSANRLSALTFKTSLSAFPLSRFSRASSYTLIATLGPRKGREAGTACSSRS
ncbi:hypothetical protein NHX12_006642 [Muraenolepis orangiensis]|uniref:Uncharacterized protein n=1 Tax=Muraenolepis orangiensis TaxID=630683 RepID=A0A9Q0IB72_9TELE|nr:hypothetical protein NHX12_006642 [Muraenolepis orangiensis]